MKSRALWLLAVLCVARVAAQPVPAVVIDADGNRAQREVLLMLRIAPAHYRPDGVYAHDYRIAPGRAARRHLADQLARAHGLLLRDAWPMLALGVDCFVLDAADPAAAQHAAQALSADPRVESAQAMQLFHGLGPAGVSVRASDRVLDRASERAPGARADADPLYATQPAAIAWHLRELHAHVTGQGVRVAVIDSGVAVDHPDLRGQVLLARDFVDDFVGRRRSVAEAHGTAVAGIIAAREGNGIGIAGIAPRARLLALRGCWQPGIAAATCSSFTLARALQFAIDAHADVINLSLGGPPDRLLARLLDVGLARGISVVSAVDPDARDGGFPASHQGVLAVASSEGAPAPAGLLRAPGTGIPATLPDGGWGLVSGSSYAAAEVAGLVALLRQAGPSLTPAQVHAALQPLAGVPSVAERPRAIDACAVMLRTAGHCVCACATASSTR